MSDGNDDWGDGRAAPVNRGAGAGRGRGGRGRGSHGGCGGFLGAGGACICPKCGQRVPHDAGVPCLQERCPNCGVAMVREGSPHHQEIEKRRADLDETH